MVDLKTILADHRTKKTAHHDYGDEVSIRPHHAEIPDLFFDQILVHYKLTRVETLILMYLYRQVWCRANLYKLHGISQLLSHTEMANTLHLDLEEIHHAIRKLEDFGFISTIRFGQYFVRRYFTKENDEVFQQDYDEFDV